MAPDARTRQVVEMAVGDRGGFTARCLWEALPRRYRDWAIMATDLLPTYRAVVPADRHAAAGREARLTAHVEQFLGTLRQRCARFVRKVLPFARRMENHAGALWYFVRLYNACRL